METELKVILSGTFAAFLLAVPILFFLFSPGRTALPLWNMATSTEAAQNAYSFVSNSDSPLVHFSDGMQVWYTNEPLDFSFRLPDGFTAPDGTLKGSTGQVVTVSNEKGDELLLLALPIQNGSLQVLSEESIRATAEGQNLSDFHEQKLTDGTLGFVFHTDAADWGGDGVGFWFVHDGYLFQLTTYAKDAELLDAVVGTFRFGTPVPPPRGTK